MAGTKKGYNDEGWEEYTVGALAVCPLFKVASVGASVVGSTVQDRFYFPCRAKVSEIVVACSAISAVDGSVLFNIVVGGGSYETANPVRASQTFTITGVPATGQNNVYVIGGNTATAPQTTGNSVTVQAAADVVIINAVPAIAALGTATSVAGVITFTASVPGPGGNGITTTSSTTGGDTVTAGGASTAGGVNATGIVPVQNDNATMPYLQQASGVQPVQVAGGGNGITTNFATAGQALFATDVPFNTANFSASAANAVISTGSGGVGVFSDTALADVQNVPGYNAVSPAGWPSVRLAASDAVFERGSFLTLRVNTPLGGSITNLQVVGVLEVRPLNWPPSPQQWQPSGSNAQVALNAPGPNLRNVRPTSGFTF